LPILGIGGIAREEVKSLAAFRIVANNLKILLDIDHNFSCAAELMVMAKSNSVSAGVDSAKDDSCSAGENDAGNYVEE
jgi:hypothetical protein